MERRRTYKFIFLFMINPKKIKSAGKVVMYQLIIAIVVSLIASGSRLKSVAPLIGFSTIIIFVLGFRFAYLLMTCDSHENKEYDFEEMGQNAGKTLGKIVQRFF